jgi:hypothetical protein
MKGCRACKPAINFYTNALYPIANSLLSMLKMQFLQIISITFSYLSFAHQTYPYFGKYQFTGCPCTFPFLIAFFRPLAAATFAAPFFG